MQPGGKAWTLAAVGPSGAFRLTVPASWAPVSLAVGPCDRLKWQPGGLGSVDDLEVVLASVEGASPQAEVELRITSPK